MPSIKSLALTALAATTLSAPALAADYLSLNGGYFDAIRHKNTAAQFGLEYRFSDIMYGIHPIVGGFVTTDGSEYGYAGLNWNVALLPNQLYLVPNFAAGLYHRGNDARDLGGPIEFRSGIELDYQFPNTHQLGVALNHISNASIYDRNPGEESVIVTYSVPIGSLFR